MEILDHVELLASYSAAVTTGVTANVLEAKVLNTKDVRAASEGEEMSSSRI